MNSDSSCKEEYKFLTYFIKLNLTCQSSLFLGLQGNFQIQIRDVKYRNIRGTSSSKIAVAFECSKAAKANPARRLSSRKLT